MTARNPSYCLDIITDEPQRRHEWRQRFTIHWQVDYPYMNGPGDPNTQRITAVPMADGYYCVHCRAIEKEANGA